jgi:regulation of enolase protein 1 (concanavalin A-like superfamily)
MQWLNEPASWQRTGDVLRVSVDPGTDFWRTTGYGYVHDNGHIYGEPLPGDLDVSVRVRGAFANQYDQAGIILRADEHTWLKTGLEFFEGRPRLSTVLTLGCSSWMVADLPPGTDDVTLRASRRGDAVEVRYSAGDGAAELAALVFMPPGREMLAGIVCAAPEGTGFSVAFHDLRIAGREWGGQETADDAGWADGSGPAAGWAQDGTAGTGAGRDGGRQGWVRERADDGARSWAGDGPDEAAPGWAGGRPDESAPGWAARDVPGQSAPGWAVGDGPAKAAPGRAEKEPGGLAFGWAGKKAGDQAGGAPARGAGELPPDRSVDWAEPQASEPAEDWHRLSLSVSGTGSWNAFAAATPAKKENGPDRPAEDGAAEPATDQAAGRPARDGEDGAAEPPGSPAGDEADPALPAASPSLAAAKPNGRNGRGRNKAKPAPSPRPTPTDAADEWISLLTADSAEELSGLGVNRPPSTPAPRLSGPGSSRLGLPGPGGTHHRGLPRPE